MTELLGNSENFNFVSASLRDSLAGNAKKGEMFAERCFGTYRSSKSLGVKLPVCPVNENKVLTPIKL